jgi:hypothetical protein
MSPVRSLAKLLVDAFQLCIDAIIVHPEYTIDTPYRAGFDALYILGHHASFRDGLPTGLIGRPTTPTDFQRTTSLR